MKNTPTQSFLPIVLLATAALAGCSRPADSGAASAPPGAVAAPAASTPGDAAAGKAVYLRVCFVCHQPTGLGLPPAFPPLAGSSIVTEADPGKIIRIVLHGLQGPVEVKGVNYVSVMPPPAPPLSDKDIADVLTYVRNEWGNSAAPVTVEAVTGIRDTEKARTTMWTWAELTKP